MPWTREELERIASAQEPQIAPVRRNGELRGPAAYRRKYGGRYASIVDSINDAEHRATTLRLTPQAAV